MTTREEASMGRPLKPITFPVGWPKIAIPLEDRYIYLRRPASVINMKYRPKLPEWF
jgi:hypothetical protein